MGRQQPCKKELKDAPAAQDRQSDESVPDAFEQSPGAPGDRNPSQKIAALPVPCFQAVPQLRISRDARVLLFLQQ